MCLFDLFRYFRNAFRWCVFALALAFALTFFGLLVEGCCRSCSYLLVGICTFYVGSVHFEDFPEAFELKCVEFAELGFCEVHGF